MYYLWCKRGRVHKARKVLKEENGPIGSEYLLVRHLLTSSVPKVALNLSKNKNVTFLVLGCAANNAKKQTAMK